MKRKASLWNIGIIAFLTLIVLIFYISYYSSRTSFKNMHYSFIMSADITQNMDALLKSMFYANVPSLNYTYSDLLIMAAIQKYKQGDTYDKKVYVGEPVGYVLLDDIIFSLFDNYFGKNNWNLTVVVYLYGDNKVILSYGYKKGKENVYSSELFIPLYHKEYAQEIRSIQLLLYVF